MFDDVENIQQDTQILSENPVNTPQGIALTDSLAVDEQVEQQKPIEKPAEESFQVRNFRELKAIAEREKREKENLARENAELKRYLQEKSAPVEQVQEEDDDFGIGADDLVEGKHVKKLNKATRQALNEAQKARKEIEALRTEREILQERPDFYKVVTKENVEAYRLLDPINAELIASHPNLKVQGIAVYDAIVRSGLDKMHDYDTQKELIKQNMAKPKPVPEVAQNGGTSALARGLDNYSGDLTDEMKRLYYQEMKKAQRGGR